LHDFFKKNYIVNEVGIMDNMTCFGCPALLDNRNNFGGGFKNRVFAFDHNFPSYQDRLLLFVPL